MPNVFSLPEYWNDSLGWVSITNRQCKDGEDTHMARKVVVISPRVGNKEWEERRIDPKRKSRSRESNQVWKQDARKMKENHWLERQALDPRAGDEVDHWQSPVSSSECTLTHQDHRNVDKNWSENNRHPRQQGVSLQMKSELEEPVMP